MGQGSRFAGTSVSNIAHSSDAGVRNQHSCEEAQMTDHAAIDPSNLPPPVATTEKTGFRLGGGAIAAISGAALLIIFMVQNTEDVTLEFLFWDFIWPLWLVVLLSATIGALVWLGLGILRRHRRRRDRRDERRD
jgi:uncharacterized integral membrane protein